MGKKIKAIVFDLGKVLIDFNHLIAAKRISCFTDKKPEEIYGLFFSSNITELFEEGKISPEDFFRRVQVMLNLKASYEIFLPIWNEIFILSEENIRVYNIAKALRKKYKVALLSNINVLHLEYLKKNFHIFEAFDQIFASCELGFIKPNPLIYKKVLKELRIVPDEVFYTDDREDLIAEAAKLGINSFVYRGTEQLKKDLTSCGIK